jgi:hypothetical protein
MQIAAIFDAGVAFVWCAGRTILTVRKMCVLQTLTPENSRTTQQPRCNSRYGHATFSEQLREPMKITYVAEVTWADRPTRPKVLGHAVPLV